MFNGNALVLSALKELSDRAMQEKIWVRKEGNEISSFAEAVNMLYEDTGLLEKLNNGIPVFEPPIDRGLIDLKKNLDKINPATPAADIVASPQMAVIREQALALGRGIVQELKKESQE